MTRHRHFCTRRRDRREKADAYRHAKAGRRNEEGDWGFGAGGISEGLEAFGAWEISKGLRAWAPSRNATSPSAGLGGREKR